jgi:hypothetical protein
MAVRGIPGFGSIDLRKLALTLALSAAIAAPAIMAATARTAQRPGRAGGMLAEVIGPARLGVLRSLKLDSEGKPPRGIEDVARAALPGSPLAYEPFFGVAAAGFRQPGSFGGTRDAELLKEALRRNPRSREARALLLRHEIGAGRTAGAIGQLAVLNRLNGGAIEKLMDALGARLATPRQVDEAVEALKPHPELYRPFITGFANANRPAELGVRLVLQLPDTALRDPEVRRLAIGELVKAKEFTAARRMWGGTAQAGTTVHSPDFSDRRSPPPFNWRLEVNESGAAERTRSGGLEVAYYGRTPGTLVSQVVTLAPGGHTLKLDYRTLGGTPGALGIELRCVGADRAFVAEPLSGRVDADQSLSLAFSVPAAECRGQTLAIVGRVQESRDPQQVQLRRLDVQRGAAQ